MNSYKDEQLVSQYLNGNDNLALEELVKRYLPILFGFVKRYTGDENNASDIVQETFVKVWKNLKHFDQSKSFRTWVFTIAKRTAIDWLRKKNALPFSVIEGNNENKKFAESIVDESISIIDQLMYRETSRELAFAVAKLPFKYNSVIKAHINNDLSFREIATNFKEPINTIKSRYRRGLLMLKEII